jgi:signal recognition particle subunit SRP54
MAFESLSQRFQNVFKKMRGQSLLTEANMDEAAREIRVALLESDVNYQVVKAFVSDVKEKALGEKVYAKVSPSEMLIKICHDEIVSLLGENNRGIEFAHGGPTTLMLVGLQGSGKTTTAGKLALHYKSKEGKRVLLAGLDVYRPAALDQLRTIAKEIGVDFFEMGTEVPPVEIAKAARGKAASENYDLLILDTAGRLSVDERLMKELADIGKETRPEETLLLVDAMSGQDAVNVANAFNKEVRLTGLIMSKLDGDAKGGAALSIKYMTGLPIKYAGVGEKLEDLDVFYPSRMADRILGMGDVVTLVEKAKEKIDEKDAERQAKKMMQGEFTLEDMLKQMKMVQKIGSLGAIAKMIPGMPNLTDEQKSAAERQMKDFETIIDSMTPYERRHPEALKFSQKNRIAKGAGKVNADVNRVLKKFDQAKQQMKMMKQYQRGGKMPGGFGGGFR